jgi:hypothetical protein
MKPRKPIQPTRNVDASGLVFHIKTRPLTDESGVAMYRSGSFRYPLNQWCKHPNAQQEVMFTVDGHEDAKTVVFDSPFAYLLTEPY